MLGCQGRSLSLQLELPCSAANPSPPLMLVNFGLFAAYSASTTGQLQKAPSAAWTLSFCSQSEHNKHFINFTHLTPLTILAIGQIGQLQKALSAALVPSFCSQSEHSDNVCKLHAFDCLLYVHNQPLISVVLVEKEIFADSAFSFSI